jgi:hypothetical protein
MAITTEELDKIEDLEIRINFLKDDFNNPESVTTLQKMINEYAYGEDKLAVDGVFGIDTKKGLDFILSQAKYWPSHGNPKGHSVIDVNPFNVSKSYHAGEPEPFRFRERLDEEGQYIE